MTPQRVTTKSLIVAAHRLNPTLDPLQLSQQKDSESKSTVNGATPSYIDQVIRAYKATLEAKGLKEVPVGAVKFVEVKENAQVSQTLDVKTVTPEKPIPNWKKAYGGVADALTPAPPAKKTDIGVKIKEPNPEDIKKLGEARKIAPQNVIEALQKGKISKEHLKSIINIENWLLKKYLDYQHDEATVDLLAEAWEKPINSYLGGLSQESEKSAFLYIAIGTTIIAHIPVIIKLADKMGFGKMFSKDKKEVPAGTVKPLEKEKPKPT